MHFYKGSDPWLSLSHHDMHQFSNNLRDHPIPVLEIIHTTLLTLQL